MRRENFLTGIIVGLLIAVLSPAAVVLAGSLEPIAGPTAADSQMYTLDQIYDRLNTGAAATKMNAFTKPGSGPTAGTMHTLNEIYELAGLRAPVPKTGQTTSYATGDDGILQKGVVWPSPRFTDNTNGTVTDNLSGLIWLKNANCFWSRTWEEALSDANGLTSGGCGLSEGSTVGQWRLPNIKELQSLIDFAYILPALSNAAGTGQWVAGDPSFTGVQWNNYWSSTTNAGATGVAWYVYLGNGHVENATKTSTLFVWPVRGGQ